MDITPFIDIVLAIAAFAVVLEMINIFAHRSVNNSLKETSTTGINAISSATTLGVNAIVALTTLSITGCQAEEISELHTATAPPQTALATVTPATITTTVTPKP